MKRKKDGGLYAYLAATGVLETGDDARIKTAKRQYWTAYKAAWRKAQRASTVQLTVVLTPREAEAIRMAAVTHKRSKTSMVKHAAFAYLNKSYLVPDVITVRSMAQSIDMTCNAVQAALKDQQLDVTETKEMLLALRRIESTILPALNYPKTVEELFHRIAATPEHVDELRRLLKKLEQ